MTCADFSDEGYSILPHARGAETGEGIDGARSNAAERAQQPAQARVKLREERLLVETCKSGRLRRLFHPYEAGSIARQRHGRKRPGAPMQLGGDRGMRARVAEAGGNGGLAVSPCAHGNFGRRAGHGVAAVGGDDEGGDQCTALGEFEVHALCAGVTLTTADVDSQRSLDALRSGGKERGVEG